MVEPDEAARAATLTPLSLSAILSSSSSSLPTSAVFRGRISSLRPYSPHTRLAALVLKPTDSSTASDDQLEVELKGWWAEKAARRFRKGEVVVLRGAGAKVLEGSVKGKEKEGRDVQRRVRFDNGLSGWVVRKDGQEEVVRYKATDRRSSTPAPEPALSRPPARSVASVKARLAQSAQPPMSAQESNTAKRLQHVVPAKRPAPPPASNTAVLSPSLPTRATTDEPRVSAPGEGSRSVKRRRQEEKLGWGLTTAGGKTYTALDQLGAVMAEAGPAYSKKLVNVLVLVSEVSDVFPPRDGGGGNWFRRFSVTCPSRPDTALEVQWYAVSAEALPDPSVGDLLVAHGLAIKGTALSPTLLAGSYDPVPLAVLSASSLLLPRPSGPTQHPAPHPPAPPCPTGTSAWTWKKMEVLPRPVGIRLEEEELKYAARVARFFRPAAGGGAAAPMASTAAAGAGAKEGAAVEARPTLPLPVSKGRGRPLLRVEELSEGHFCDMVVMITKFRNPTSHSVGSIPSNLSTQLFVTDYTPHPLLHAYSAPTASREGVGLAGQLVLQVSLFGYQSEPLLHAGLLQPDKEKEGGSGIRRGTLVHLRNVRVKLNEAGLLEATMVEESVERYRSKRDVTVLRDGKVWDEQWKVAAKAVQRRHREYWAAKSAGA
ncbi:hypothetical protein JCM10207_005523 [Rhodosporidiobolus poonsookiae]